MNEKIICFALGLASEDVEKGKASLSAVNQEEYALEVMAVTDAMLAMKVGDALEQAAEGLKEAGQKELPPGLFPCRVVVVATPDRERVFQIMRSFKAVLPDPQDLIFAVVTETALDWTFGAYIGHLMQEHEEMKTRK